MYQPGVLVSLRARIHVLHVLWARALDDMTLLQINYHERAGVLPIAFSLVHAIRAEDHSVHRWMLGRPPLWQTGGWAERTGVTLHQSGSGERLQQMEQQRLGNLDAWKAYQASVFAVTERQLAVVDLAMLGEVVIPAMPATDQGFGGLVVGAGNPMHKLDVLECWVYQHGLRHLGEVEHARALVGLGGLAG